MAAVATGFKGIDNRQTGGYLVWRALIQNSSGLVTSGGSASLRIYQLMSDATIQTYDWSNNSFVASGSNLFSGKISAVYQLAPLSGGTGQFLDTGLWTVSLSPISGFTVGGIYFQHFNSASGQPQDQIREFQYGSAEGDLITLAVPSTSGQAYLETDVRTCVAGPLVSGSIPGAASTLSGGAVTVGPSSGQLAATASGLVTPVSGNTYIASGPFVVASGTFATLASGTTYIASGISVVAIVLSGTNYLASGSVFLNTFASGVLGASGGLPVVNVSGGVIVATNLDKSGYTGTVISGTTYIASGASTVTTASVTVVSGSLYLASGSILLNTFASGVLGASGGLPVVNVSGGVVVATNLDKSGYTGTVISGTTYPASGPEVIATINSGSLYLASGSVFLNTFASGVLGASGGLPVVNVSGGVIIATNLDKSGYSLSASGLDTIPIENAIVAGVNLINDAGTQLTSINLRQAISLNMGALAGKLSGAGTATILIDPAGQPTSGPRVQATCDLSGNRTSLILKVPV